MKLNVILFDKNCEPVVTGARLEFADSDTSIEVAEDKIVFERLTKAMSEDPKLREAAEHLGYDVSLWEYGDFSIQHDTRDQVIRFRCAYDCVGEPGNILAMADLYYNDEED